MADRRIRIDASMCEFVEELWQGTEAMFAMKADVLSFAAALGFARERRTPLASPGSDPVPMHIFEHHGYGTLINLAAVCQSGDVESLGQAADVAEARAVIFEEFANGGLHCLKESLEGIVDREGRMAKLAQVAAAMRDTDAEDKDDLDIADLTAF
jgi:dnd system-associated protein 4